MAADLEQGGVGAQTLGTFQKFGVFLGEVRNEMRKVTSPSRKEVQATTLVVIVTVFIFGAYFWGVDKVMGSGIEWLLKLGR